MVSAKSGGTTHAIKQGCSQAQIQFIGRWKCLTTANIYHHDLSFFLEEAANKMAAKQPTGYAPELTNTILGPESEDFIVDEGVEYPADYLSGLTLNRFFAPDGGDHYD